MEVNKKDEFVAIIDTHKKIIYKIVNSYCKNVEDRKDLEQEIIIQLWNSYDKYDAEYKYSTWMYRIALNVAISFYRKQKKWLVRNEFYSEDSIYCEVDEHEDEFDHNINVLKGFINNLNELNKALMLLHIEDTSYDEMAEILGFSRTNVATKISRLKRKLKKEFQKHIK